MAGIALTALYAPNGWIGRWTEAVGLKVAYTPIGITIALVFVGLPFIVRTVQPVLHDLDREIEEASATLGASRVEILYNEYAFVAAFAVASLLALLALVTLALKTFLEWRYGDALASALRH